MGSTRKLKAWAKYDRYGKLVFGSVLFRKKKPSGNFKLLDTISNECCEPIYTTTTTTTTSGFDPDAQAFFIAAGINDPVEKNAWNTFIVSAKIKGYYSDIILAFPLLGSSPETAAFDAISKTSLVIWNRPHGNDSIEFSTTGAKFPYFPSTTTPTGYGLFNAPVININSFGMHYYSRDADDTSNTYQTGSFSSGPDNFVILQTRNSNQIRGAIGGGFSEAVLTPNTDNIGFYSIVRSNSTTLKAYKNGVQVGSTQTATNPSAVFPTTKIAINGLAQVDNTVVLLPKSDIGIIIYTNGMNDAAVADLNADVQAFLISTSRNV